MKNKVKENSFKALFMMTAIVSIIAVIVIFVFLLLKGIPAFQKIGFFKFLFGDVWNSNAYDTFAEPLVGTYGIFTMIVGTIFSTLGALLIGGPLGFFTAVFLAKYCPKRLKRIITSLINLLAGIPSVIYGFFGMKLVLPLLGTMSPNGDGSGLLATSFILAIMITPTIVSLSKNAIEASPAFYYEGARALGASHDQAVFKVVVPSAKSGIIASLILGVGRALGETMAVVMVAGNSATYPTGLFSSFRTLTANVVIEMGYAGEVQMSALIATGVVLLMFVIIINSLFNLALSKGNKNKSKKKVTFINNLTNKIKPAFNKKTTTVEIAQETNLNQIAKNEETASKSKTSRFKKKKETTKPKNELLDKLTTCFYNVKNKIKTEKICAVMGYISVGIVTFTLAAIIIFVFVKGVPYITWDFLFSDFEYGGKISILPSIVATLMLVFLCIVIAIPLGVMTAIYLNEYTKKGSKLVKLVRNAVEILSGIPSIVYGLFGMIFFCNILKMGTSILAGAFTISIMLLPTIVRSTEESLKAVPDSFREGSFALGAGKLRTIFKVVLPSALPGILSAVILSIGRVISESAPLIFTMGASLKPMPKSGFMSGGTTLAVALYKLAGEGLHVNEAYATACVLIVLVLALNLISELIARVFSKRTTASKK